MKFIKTLVAVSALAATGSVFARAGDPAESTTGGEMILSIWSAAAEASYALDIGLLYSEFATKSLATVAGGAPYSFTIDLNAATDLAYNNNNAAYAARYGSGPTPFELFLAAVDGRTDVNFSFLGGDNSGVSANLRNMATTIKAGGDVTKITNGNIVDGMNSIANNYISDTSGGVNTRISGNVGNMVPNGSGFFTVSDGAGYYLKFAQPTLNGKFAAGNGNALGSTADMYYFVRSSTSAGGDALETLIGQISLTQTTPGSYQLMYMAGAVPEASTYALMGLGLVGISLVARRRQQA